MAGKNFATSHARETTVARDVQQGLTMNVERSNWSLWHTLKLGGSHTSTPSALTIAEPVSVPRSCEESNTTTSDSHTTLPGWAPTNIWVSASADTLHDSKLSSPPLMTTPGITTELKFSEVPPPTVSIVPDANVVPSSATVPALLSKMEPLSVVVDAEKLESVTVRPFNCCPAQAIMTRAPPPETLKLLPTATNCSVKLPCCCTMKPPPPQRGGCGSEALPLTLTRWPGRTTRSVWISASSRSITANTPGAPDTTAETML
eukprot:COSAG02_NODE_6641_length_3441_cov_5.384201_2_plen_260_part_00